MSDTPGINMQAVQNNSVHKQAVKDLLAIDDVAGYLKDPNDPKSYVPGYEPASFTKKLFDLKTLGVSPATENALTTPKADIQQIQKKLLKKLSAAEKTTYENSRETLTKPESKEDLVAAIKSLPNSPHKQTIIDLLVIDDIAGYTNKAGKFVAGYEVARFVSNYFKLTTLGVSKKIETALITPKADMQKIQKGLTAKLDTNAKNVYFTLRNRMTLPESGDDLVTTYCKLDSAESFCPKVSSVTPAEVNQGATNAKVVITGVNLPKDPKVDMGEKIQVKVVRANNKEIEVLITVANDTALGLRDFTVSTKAGWLEAKGKIEVAAKTDLPPFCNDGIDNDKDGKIDAADPDCKPGGKGEIAPKVDLNQPGCKDKIDNDKDGKIDGDDEDCLVNAGGEIKKKVKTAPLTSKPKPSTTMEKAAFWLQKKLKLEVPVYLGGRGFISGKKLTDLPYQNRAAAETDPNITAGVEINPTILGTEKEGALVKNDLIELNTPAKFKYTHFLQNKESLMLEAAVGAKLKLKTPWASPEAYANYGFKYADMGYPNKWFFSGMNHEAVGGIAVSHQADWANKFKFMAKLFVESHNSFFDWDKETVGFPFKGSDHAIKVGVEGTLPFTKLSDHWAIPDLTLRVAGTPWGTHEVPEIMPGFSSSSREGMTGWEAEAKLAFNNLKKYKPFIKGGYKETYIKGWPTISEAFWGVGVTSPEAGTFIFKGGSQWNINPYYGDNRPLFTEVNWTMPEEWAGGRLSGITLKLGCGLTKYPTAKEPYFFGGIEFKLGKVVTGKAPEEIIYPEPAPVKKEKKVPLKKEEEKPVKTPKRPAKPAPTKVEPAKETKKSEDATLKEIEALDKNM